MRSKKFQNESTGEDFIESLASLSFAALIYSVLKPLIFIYFLREFKRAR